MAVILPVEVAIETQKGRYILLTTTCGKVAGSRSRRILTDAGIGRAQSWGSTIARWRAYINPRRFYGVELPATNKRYPFPRSHRSQQLGLVPGTPRLPCSSRIRVEIFEDWMCLSNENVTLSRCRLRTRKTIRGILDRQNGCSSKRHVSRLCPPPLCVRYFVRR